MTVQFFCEKSMVAGAPACTGQCEACAKASATAEAEDAAEHGAVEKFYESEIAPKLLQIAELCARKDFGFAAMVEYDPPAAEVTVSPKPSNCGPAMRIVAYAMMAEGNVDVLIKALLKDAAEHGHSSTHLSVLQQAMANAQAQAPGEVKH